MTKEELISKGKAKVRNTPSLLLIYIDLYKERFGKKPNCAACTFNDDWNRFVNGSSNRFVRSAYTIVTPKTFRLKEANRKTLL